MTPPPTKAIVLHRRKPSVRRRDQLDRIAQKADGLAVHLEAIRKRGEARVARDLAAAAREITR